MVAYEPGQFVLPDNEPVKHVATDKKIASEVLNPILVPASEFLKLTKMPIMVVFGENIVDSPNANFNQWA